MLTIMLTLGVTQLKFEWWENMREFSEKRTVAG